MLVSHEKAVNCEATYADWYVRKLQSITVSIYRLNVSVVVFVFCDVLMTSFYRTNHHVRKKSWVVLPLLFDLYSPDLIITISFNLPQLSGVLLISRHHYLSLNGCYIQFFKYNVRNSWFFIYSDIVGPIVKVIYIDK